MYNTKCTMSNLRGSYTDEDWEKLLNEIKADKEKQSGFFDLDKNTICTDNQHNPPSHLLVPPGKGYKHVCPGCGQIKIIVDYVDYLYKKMKLVTK